jgi:phosphoribosylamine--glycine ligase
MAVHGVPTARSGVFTDAHAARMFATSLGGRCVVKADGLALGKGVLMANDQAEADRAIEDIMLRRAFGRAGEQIVIQEHLEGMEISLHALCDGHVARLFPTAQDHKRIRDGDQGPNTGGMGTYSPAPFLTEDELLATARAILEPWQRGCSSEGIDFRGILYPGVMLTREGPKVLEFNARFGDPETQVYLTRMENDLVELLDASVSGTLNKAELRWSPMASVCVVMASEGYPGTYRKGVPIDGVASVASLPNVKVFHAGTARIEDTLVTHGGRVLGITAWAPTLEAAQSSAYAAVDLIRFEGAQFRSDIAAKAIGHGAQLL